MGLNSNENHVVQVKINIFPVNILKIFEKLEKLYRIEIELSKSITKISIYSHHLLTSHEICQKILKTHFSLVFLMPSVSSLTSKSNESEQSKECFTEACYSVVYCCCCSFVNKKKKNVKNLFPLRNTNLCCFFFFLRMNAIFL